MQKYKTRSLFSRFKYGFSSQCSQTKGRLIFAIVVVLTCFVAGIIVSASTPNFYPADEYILDFAGAKSGFGAFFSRSFSQVVILSLTFVFSLTIWTMPFAVIVIGFRGYLLGFNICLLCANFGLSGLLDAILIVLPCQLAMLILFTLYFAFITKACQNCRRFGSNGSGRGKLFIIFLFYLIIVNLVETLLLTIFSSKVILVI